MLVSAADCLREITEDTSRCILLKANNSGADRSGLLGSGRGRSTTVCKDDSAGKGAGLY